MARSKRLLRATPQYVRHPRLVAHSNWLVCAAPQTKWHALTGCVCAAPQKHRAVDQVVVLRNGRVWLCGPPAEVLRSAGPDLAQYALGPPVSLTVTEEGTKETTPVGTNTTGQGASIPGGNGGNSSGCNNEADGAGDSAEGCRRREGAIAWADFKVYAQSFGTSCQIICLVTVAVFASGLNVAGTAWLAHWTDASDAGSGGTTSRGAQVRYLAVYVAVGGGTAVMLALQTLLVVGPVL